MSTQTPTPPPAPDHQPLPTSGGRRRGAPWWLFVAVTVLAVVAMGSCAGALGTSTDTSADASPAPTVTVTAQRNGDPAPTVTSTVTEAVVETSVVTETLEVGPPEPEAAFGDGFHLIGTDVQPGVYRATGVENCYWARLSSLAGDLDAILANENISTGDAIVEILPTDVAFESNRCGSWSRVG